MAGTAGPMNVTAEVDYKEKAAMLINEYFSSADVDDVADSLEELDKPLFQYYFAKAAIKLAMDRTDREKEMVAQLLTSLCENDVLLPGQVSKAFVQLLETVSDMTLDVPDAPRLLTLFLVRAHVDDILPKPFLRVCAGSLQDETAKQVANDALTMLTADKDKDISEWIMRVWGNPAGISADEASQEVEALVSRHLADPAAFTAQEVQAGLQSLHLPFFHHEFVKCAVLAAARRKEDAPLLLALMQALVQNRQLSTSQVAKGFGRAMDNLEASSSAAARVEELEAQCRSQGLFDQAPEEASPDAPPLVVSDHGEREFKEYSERIVREYFSSGSAGDAKASLIEFLDGSQPGAESTIPASPDLRRCLLKFFVKRCVTVSLDHTNREKEMAASLISSLYPDVLPLKAIQEGYTELCTAVEDLALDIPDAVHEVAVFVARAVVDDALPPVFATHLHSELRKAGRSEEVAVMVGVFLGARHAAERVLSVWGGNKVGTVGHSKEGMAALLKEYLVSQDVEEARRCLRALNCPHYHHELVKRALVYAIEQPPSTSAPPSPATPTRERAISHCPDKVLVLLKALANSADISASQMAQGFGRMREGIDDLSLDVPGAQMAFETLEQDARGQHILD